MTAIVLIYRGLPVLTSTLPFFFFLNIPNPPLTLYTNQSPKIHSLKSRLHPSIHYDPILSARCPNQSFAILSPSSLRVHVPKCITKQSACDDVSVTWWSRNRKYKRRIRRERNGFHISTFPGLREWNSSQMLPSSSRRYRSSSPFLLPSSAQTHVDSILGFWQTLINYRCPCALLFSIQISSTLASTPSSSSSSSWWRRNRVPTRVLKGINLPPTPRPGAAASCPSSTYILQEYRQFIRSWTIYPTSSSHADMYVCMYTKVNVKVEQQRSRLRVELGGTK